MSTTKYPQVRVRLAGEDGNAYAIMGRVCEAMKRAGIPKEERDAYMAESMQSDYTHLLRTAMAWVNCDGMGDDNIGKRYTNSSPAMEEYWDAVEDAVQDALLIAWDTCHKIYLAMDSEQADWFREHYSDCYFTGTPDEMLALLHDWYEQSCPLKFIQAVTTTDNPNDGYESLIPQGAEDEGMCEECGNHEVHADGLCEYCWYDANDYDECEYCEEEEEI